MNKITISLMCMLTAALSGTLWGYGLDGTLDSSEFANYMGPSPAYQVWSYEGGVPGAPLEDILGNTIFSSYDSIALYYSSDGNVMTHAPDETSASFSTGFYKPWYNHYYLPSGSENNHAIWGTGINDEDGFTVEWRARITNVSAWGLATGYYFGFNVDECAGLWVRIGGYNDTDSVAKFPGRGQCGHCRCPRLA